MVTINWLLCLLLLDMLLYTLAESQLVFVELTNVQPVYIPLEEFEITEAFQEIFLQPA